MLRSRHNFSSARRGFTLLELILAMGMVAIIATSMFATMRVAFNSQKSATAAIEPSRTAELAMQFIREDLQNTLPPHDPQSYTSQFQYIAGSFEGQTGGMGGSDADLTFFSTGGMRDHVSGNGEIKQIELTTEQPAGASEKCLVRKCARNLLVEQQPPPYDEEILCRGIESFTVRYFDGSNWNDVWDSTQMTPNELPVAVEVTVTLARPLGPQGAKQLIKFVRIFQLPCSTAATDTDTSGGLGL